MRRVLNDEDAQLAAVLPLRRPFLVAEARDLGVTKRQLARLVEVHLLSRPFLGVYLPSAVKDSVPARLEVLRLVLPQGCVVTDRTAGWVWAGDRILAPNDHLATPTLSVYCRPGHRLRSKLTDSGERRFEPRDVVDLDGLTVTTPLRTACDLGRLLHRDQALASLDSMAATGEFTLEELILESGRFKRYRGVIQLRAFVTIVDPRSQSQGESILRLRWYDAGLPRPQCQVEVETPWGVSYWLDIGHVELRLAAEYDGDQFHGDDQRAHDAGRRSWISEERGWIIEVARRENVHGHEQDIHERLQKALRQAKSRKNG